MSIPLYFRVNRNNWVMISSIVLFSKLREKAQGTFSLTITEKYPKITFAMGELNAFYGDSTTQITARADDGTPVKILSLSHVNASIVRARKSLAVRSSRHSLNFCL